MVGWGHMVQTWDIGQSCAELCGHRCVTRGWYMDNMIGWVQADAASFSDNPFTNKIVKL